MFDQYKNAVISTELSLLKSGEWPAELKVSQEGDLSTFYAPFDHMNRAARVVLVGITPGDQQARNALHAAQLALRQGASERDALQQAKVYASFSGTMRRNLVAMLDHVGLNSVLGIESCATLWDENSQLVHFTSALRYPVFKGSKNYSGNPSISKTPYLREQVIRWTGNELCELRDAWIVPLGMAAAEACDLWIRNGQAAKERVLRGIPHPSGANIERIKYFLGQKEKQNLSTKVNADLIESAREAVLHQLRTARVKSAGATS